MRLPVLNLRQRFLAIMAIAGLLSAIPVVYLSYSYAVENSIAQATLLFDQQVKLVNELIEINYIESVANTAQNSITDTEEMSNLAAGLQRIYLNPNSPPSVIKAMQKSMSEHGIEMMVCSGTEPVLGNPWIESLVRENVSDYRGISLRELLRNNTTSKASAIFTTLRVDLSGPKLVGIWHLPQQESMILVKSSMQRERDYEKAKFVTISQVAASLEQLQLPEAASIAILSSRGKVLTSAGAPFPKPEDIIEIFSSSAQGRGAHGLTEKSPIPYHYSVFHFRPYDWYITAVIPQQVITTPALHEALVIAATILGVFLITGIVAAILVSRAVRPLAAVTEQAHKLSQIDFSEKRDFAGELLKDFTFAERSDEIGRLSHAFTHMIKALDASITRLKTTLATQQRMEGELNAGHDIQNSILTPCDTPFTAPGFEAYAFMEPAKEVAGDLYEVIEAPDGRQAIIVGDVSGKGVSAALFMSMTITLIRSAIADGHGPAEILQRVNDQLAKNNPTCMFVTLWIGLFDPKSGALTFANGGHCPPALINAREGSPLRWISELSGPVVGPMEGVEFTEFTTTLAPADICVIYTDGISEAMNAEHQLFGEERIGQVVSEHRTDRPEQMLKTIMDAVLAYRGETPQSDDITMVAFTRTE